MNKYIHNTPSGEKKERKNTYYTNRHKKNIHKRIRNDYMDNYITFESIIQSYRAKKESD
jgi:hypothetical protein